MNLNTYHFFKMSLWTGVSEKMIPSQLKGCEVECPLKMYLKMVEQILPEDEDKKILQCF